MLGMKPNQTKPPRSRRDAEVHGMGWDGIQSYKKKLVLVLVLEEGREYEDHNK